MAARRKRQHKKKSSGKFSPKLHGKARRRQRLAGIVEQRKKARSKKAERRKKALSDDAEQLTQGMVRDRLRQRAMARKTDTPMEVTCAVYESDTVQAQSIVATEPAIVSVDSQVASLPSTNEELHDVVHVDAVSAQVTLPPEEPEKAEELNAVVSLLPWRLIPITPTYRPTSRAVLERRNEFHQNCEEVVRQQLRELEAEKRQRLKPKPDVRDIFAERLDVPDEEYNEWLHPTCVSFSNIRNRLVTTQIELINVITDLCATIQSTEHDDWTRGRVQARQELLQGYWEDFMSNHLELMEPDNDDPSYDRASNYALVQGQYVDATGVLYDVQSRLQPEPRRPDCVMVHLEAPASAQSHSRLPQINVPDFSGRREDWESFRDLFNALIHQSSHLSNVERLYYLKTLVRGDARSALDSLQLTGDNYDTAWKLLESRYENRRLLVHEHLLALRSLKPLREPSAKAFQQLIDTLSRHRDQLRTLKCPVDTWDAWFISIAASCMDPITRQAWEADLERNDAENGVDRAARKGDHLASFDDLSTFLNSRCRMAVACSSGAATTTRQSTSSSDHRPARAYATRQGRQDCVRCGSEHYVGHCDAFASMNSAERRELVMQQRLCFNCLRPGHAVRACPSRSTCQTCGATHHTLLHEGARKRAASSHEPGPPAKTRSTSLATLENAAPGAHGTDDEQSAEPP
ncbi:unnamed protein product [Trichogramma brassicae]|uniref:CCHC-type domain-containing protein n=1 Tax=Trichogramma brassicae TaxID=86971 RepID=A0A6H5IMY8_9HYME|nr:unnamed protein product [Trichogramma brassicae]